jgi:ech hydrogenase subunit E
MSPRTVVPFGPQHPVLVEPIHLDLVLEDERVVDAIPSVGFIHRGLEMLVQKKDFIDYVFVADRICGICSFIHSLTYCLAVEGIMNIEVPERTSFLRVIWSELSRIQSHLLWLGLLADGMGFESLFMHVWRMREKILDIIEETTGGRVIFGSCKVGGVRRDIEPGTLNGILERLVGFEAELKEITGVFVNDSSVRYRLCGIGVVSRQDAYDLGAVGPTLRGSGNPIDIRQTGYAAYSAIEFTPVVEADGDCYARCMVRIREIFQSIDMIRQAAGRIPGGPIEVKVKGKPEGESFTRTEQPRGEVVYYVLADGNRNLKRLRVRTPTFANIPALLKMLPGCELADVPVIVLTIDPCISCMER